MTAAFAEFPWAREPNGVVGHFIFYIIFHQHPPLLLSSILTAATYEVRGTARAAVRMLATTTTTPPVDCDSGCAGPESERANAVLAGFAADAVK